MSNDLKLLVSGLCLPGFQFDFSKTSSCEPFTPAKNSMFSPKIMQRHLSYHNNMRSRDSLPSYLGDIYFTLVMSQPHLVHVICELNYEANHYHLLFHLHSYRNPYPISKKKNQDNGETIHKLSRLQLTSTHAWVYILCLPLYL